MDYRYKFIVFRVLSMLPNRIGDLVYNTLQAFLGSLNGKRSLRATRGTLKDFNEILQKEENVKISGVIEMGSGWYPSLPYILTLEKGVNKVFTFDKNLFYNSKRIQEINDLFNLKKGGQLIDQVDYFPKKDLINCDLPKDGNLFISRFVLEHVPPSIIERVHKNLIEKTEEHYVLHYISPGDHRAYSDHSLGLQDFLQFSEKQWERNFTRFDYHNRMRLPEYRKLFKDLGYHTIYESFELPGDKHVEKFKAMKLDDRFKGFSDEENLAGSIIIFLKYKNGK